ncbi:protein of unknown function [Paraburkholderia kururiensis]
MDDPRVASVVRRCLGLPGHELFQFVDENGSLRPVSSTDINTYLRKATGADFTAKDYRTWAGSVLALGALRRIEAQLEREAEEDALKRLREIAQRLTQELTQKLEQKLEQKTGQPVRRKLRQPAAQVSAKTPSIGIWYRASRTSDRPCATRPPCAGAATCTPPRWKRSSKASFTGSTRFARRAASRRTRRCSRSCCGVMPARCASRRERPRGRWQASVRRSRRAAGVVRPMQCARADQAT